MKILRQFVSIQKKLRLYTSVYALDVVEFSTCRLVLVRTRPFVSDEELARRLQQEEDDQYTPSPPSSPYRTRSTSPQKRHQGAPLSLRELENAVLERVDRRNEWVANGDGGVGERERDDAPASLKEIMEEEEALHLSRKEYVRACVIGGGICKGSHDWCRDK